MSLFEIVDATNDEIYYTLAVYADLEIAKSELLAFCNENCALTENGNDGDFEKIEIREHELGWGLGCKTIFKVTRSKNYNDETDDSEWVTEYV